MSTQTYGTLAYQPAELLQEGKLTKAADVHSFSMIMYEMYTKKRLFVGCNTGQVSYAPAALVTFSPDQASAQVQCHDSPNMVLLHLFLMFVGAHAWPFQGCSCRFHVVKHHSEVSAHCGFAEK